MATYAAKTEVTVDKSRAEIERTLTRYGADQFIYGWDAERAVIGFRMHERHVKFLLPLPDKSEQRFTHSKRGRRSEENAFSAWEQACRQRWRALALVVKAKLEAVEAGITEFEDEFMAHIVMPDGQTVTQHVKPTIAAAYETGHMKPLLPAPGA
jgi:hypothetical protein